MFLTDGDRQLKIAYNPKVSSFKDTILEQKIDTIGNKYPFFFRNNQVKYKEISISGLISYLMDENNLFLSNEELGLLELTSDKVLTPMGVTSAFNEIKTKTTQLFNYNYTAERKFKLSVLDWLTNGERSTSRSRLNRNYDHLQTYALEWLTYGNYPVNVDRPSSKDGKFYIGTSSLIWIKAFFWFIFPMLLSITCISIQVKRKRK